MKKVLTVGIALLMVLLMSVTVFAKPENFVSSPSGNAAPELIEGTPESEDCEAELVITPYSDRNELSPELKEQFEKAYNEIIAAADLTDLNAELEKIAKDKNIPVENLTVSDLFDISYVSCKEHEGHGYFEIVLKAEILERFVALLHFNKGTWELIDNAQVKDVNGELRLTFKVKEFSPFAVVIDSEGAVDNDPPKTGEDSLIYIIAAAVVAVSAMAIVIIVRKTKKQSV